MVIADRVFQGKTDQAAHFTHIILYETFIKILGYLYHFYAYFGTICIWLLRSKDVTDKHLGLFYNKATIV